MVDVLRRIAETSQLAKALLIDQEIRANKAEGEGNSQKAERIRGEEAPWMGVHGREFELTGVEGEGTKEARAKKRVSREG